MVGSWSVAPANDDNLAARVARLEAVVAARDAEIARTDQALIVQVEPIRMLEAALEEARRGGKRQAAPFSKGNPEASPKQVGREHGRHGRRRAPVRPPDRELDAGTASGAAD